MKLTEPANANYAAVVVRLPKLLDLAGCDNLLGAPLLGFQAIVSKDHNQGDIGIVFGAECQLDADYMSVNGLYRHSELNKNPEAKGYIEENRRVRSIKLRGHRSDCLFMPLDSLSYTGIDVSELKEGDTFDRLGDYEICKKYVIKTKEQRGQKAQVKRFVRVDPKLFPEHISTDNWFRNSHLIDADAHVYVTQKVHGTSWRGSRSLVLRKLAWKDRVAKRFGVKVDEHEWDAVAGSRKVIKDPGNPLQNDYYDSDIWTLYLDRIGSLIPEGFVVYGELIGQTPEGASIQANYDYEYTNKQCELFVYRVATVNVRGVLTDLSWPQVRQWCNERDLKHVPDLWEGKHGDFVAEDWLDKRFHEAGYSTALPLGDNKKLVDEGVCVRMDALVPVILKAKSPVFLAHETKLLDKGESDMESDQAEDAA